MIVKVNLAPEPMILLGKAHALGTRAGTNLGA